MKLSQELIGILAVGATLIGLQVAVFVGMERMETRMRQDIGAVRDEMGVLREDIRHDINALRIDIQDIREDVRQLRDKLLVPA